MYVMSLTHSWSGPVYHIFKAVPADGSLFTELPLIHMPEFGTAYAAVSPADLMDKIYDELFLGDLSEYRLLITFEISLLRDTKQPAKTRYRIYLRVFCMQVLYCLVPAFFLMGMLNFASATLIISS